MKVELLKELPFGASVRKKGTVIEVTTEYGLQLIREKKAKKISV